MWERIWVTPARRDVALVVFKLYLSKVHLSVLIAAVILGFTNPETLLAQAIINNASPQTADQDRLLQMGIDREGQLNVPGGTPSSETGTSTVGLRFCPNNTEAIAPGCACEGWGIADIISMTSGWANNSTGVVNITPISFSISGSGTKPESVGDSAVSVVEMGGILKITHDYHPSISPALYEAAVTVENISSVPVQPVYRRLQDFDVEPTAFNEYITINIGTASNLLFSNDNGFFTSDPLVSPAGTDLALCGETVSFVDCGPADHGALFDFALGTLPPGGDYSFNIYYGASENELNAIAALGSVGAEVFSMGQTATDPVGGTPNTFVFGFTNVGGMAILPRCTLAPQMAVNVVGDPHTVTLTLIDNNVPVVGESIFFQVVSGPHVSVSGTGVTDPSGQASFTYVGSSGGTDIIEAIGIVDGDPFRCRATKRWVVEIFSDGFESGDLSAWSG